MNKITFPFNGKECEGIQIGYGAHSSDFDINDWAEYTVYYNHQLLNVRVDLFSPSIIGQDEFTGEYIMDDGGEEYKVKVIYDNVVIPKLDESLKEEIIKDLDWD